jgi:ABC-type lipoprotein export system ATPase subunit
MALTQISRGSEWRKWDLHLHTPDTKLNDNFSGVNDTWKTYCEKIENSDVAVFALTDYFCADNYFTFLEKHKTYFPESKKKFFPNIEFRLEVSVNKKAEEVNIHIIFSNTVTKNKIDEFLLKLNTNITRNGAKVSCRALAEKREFESAGVDYTKIKEKLIEVFGNEHCYIIIAAANNAGLRPDNKSPRKLNITDEIDKISDGFYGGRQNVEYYLNVDRYETDEKAKAKPVVCGCDAHSFTDIDNFLGKQFVKAGPDGDEVVKDITWVKAEPIFEGLLQIFNEPSRVFIGTMPPVLKRVQNNPTKYISNINISKSPDSQLPDGWFNNFNVSFNPELVAIIGNKGKGKSALSDILGLSANAHIDEDDFSFLNRSKFRNPRPNIARDFNAHLNWMAGSPDVVNLDAQSKMESPERVKYIPQSFLEKLCTSIDKKIFEAELEKVIFSRLEDYQKLGKATLQEVLNEKKMTLTSEITRLKNEIEVLNTTVIEHERKNSYNYRTSIQEALLAKQNELNVHEASKPVNVVQPTETEESRLKTAATAQKITELRQSINTFQGQLTGLNSERSRIAVEINEINQAVQTLNALSLYIDNSSRSLELLFTKYGLNAADIVSYKISVTPLNALLTTRQTRLQQIASALIGDNPNNPENLIKSNETAILKLQEELDGENKVYQQYLSKEQEWLKIKNDLLGSNEKEGSVIYLQSVKKYLDEQIIVDLQNLYKRRKDLLLNLLGIKLSIADLYRDLYRPVTEFISQNKNELSDYNVNIDVALEINGFDEKFFNFVSNGASGSFYGATEGRQMLAKITEVVDFNNIEEAAGWVEKIIGHLQKDHREGQNPDNKKELALQLKGSFKEKDFYDFLFNMDYYEPTYQLKLGVKSLSELSPGERGALLLIFYLLLDKQDIPIIIDQPEENLDNQSVYNILVHFIKKAKERRQIIIVTHNPNLAVVCDAEQIIRMDIAKENKNLVSMISGGIENPQINRAIVNILEGTRPAFNNRTFKYEVTNEK